MGPSACFILRTSSKSTNLRYSTVAVALWAMEAAPITPTLALTVDTILQGGVGPIIYNNPPWSPKGREV